jgi:two-component system LytT family response regulator
MNKIPTLIADDEKPARRILRQLVLADAELELVGEAMDGHETIEQIRALRPRLLLLDVQMPGKTGLDVLNALPAGERPEVVFVTAHDNHALSAFDYHAVDYLVKPFTNARFHRAIERVKHRIHHGNFTATENVLRALAAQLQQQQAAPASATEPPMPSYENARLAVKVDGELHFVKQRDLRWVESQGDYVNLHLHDRRLMVRMPMKRIVQLLHPTQFVRIHKSTLINVACLERIVATSSCTQAVRLDDGTTLLIGPAFRRNLDRAKNLLTA